MIHNYKFNAIPNPVEHAILADTATTSNETLKLTNPITITEVSFDGSKNVTLPGRVYSGTNDPTSSLGSNGGLYIKVEE